MGDRLGILRVVSSVNCCRIYRFRSQGGHRCAACVSRVTTLAEDGKSTTFRSLLATHTLCPSPDTRSLDQDIALVSKSFGYKHYLAVQFPSKTKKRRTLTWR